MTDAEHQRRVAQIVERYKRVRQRNFIRLFWQSTVTYLVLAGFSIWMQVPMLAVIACSGLALNLVAYRLNKKE